MNRRESYDEARMEFLTQISAKTHPLGCSMTNSLRARRDDARQPKRRASYEGDKNFASAIAFKPVLVPDYMT